MYCSMLHGAYNVKLSIPTLYVTAIYGWFATRYNSVMGIDGVSDSLSGLRITIRDDKHFSAQS